MRKPRVVVAGIDPSLTNTHWFAAPLNWGGDWSLCSWGRHGYELPKNCSTVSRLERCHEIAVATATDMLKAGVTHVYVEHYAFAQAEQAHQLGELGYALRWELFVNFVLQEAPLTSIRSLLIGKSRARRGEPDIKLQVFEAAKAAGLPAEFGGKRKESLDRSDAFAAMNYGMAELGGHAFMVGR